MEPKYNDTERTEVKDGGSTWLAAHLAITIPLLIFIAALIYVLSIWPSKDQKSDNTNAEQSQSATETPGE